MKKTGFILATLSLGCLVNAQKPSELEILLDPAVTALRPLESVVVQVRAFAEVPVENGEAERVRVLPGVVEFQLSKGSGGWLSKPFRFQGEDTRDWHEPGSASLKDLWIGRARDLFLRQDSVLYTAPATEGAYFIQARSQGLTAEVEIQVDARVPSIRRAETQSFPVEAPDGSRFRALAEHHAPFVAQATWFEPKADYLTRFDFDGDWKGDNNWDSTPEGSSQAYVYYAAMETGTHWFLVYSFFHPRDYTDSCVPGMCHENDCEGVVLTVLKDGSRFGRLQVLETLAHDNVYSYRNDPRLKKKAHGFDGRVDFFESSHPVVFVESGGHGVYGASDRRSRYDPEQDSFLGTTGVTYVFKGVAERPRHGSDRRVGYELLSSYRHLWLRSDPSKTSPNATFAEYFDYSPYGDRPDTRLELIAGAFLGRQFGTNKAKPFWGWHDRKTAKKKITATGQWALDPAYSVGRHFRFPRPFSMSYVYNPFLIGPHTLDNSSEGWEDPPGGSRAEPREEAAGTFLAVEASDYSPDLEKGRFDVRLQVDGTLDIRIQGRRISYQVLGGGKPADLGSSFSQELPQSKVRNFRLKTVQGRGRVVLLEGPSPSNHHSAAIRVEDPRRGSSVYHIQLRWSR